MKMKKVLLLTAFSAVFFYGSYSPSAEAYSTWTEMAGQYENPGYEADGKASLSPEILSQWWKVFHDDTLNELIDTALDHNRDLEAARARLGEARASLGISKASKVPWLNAGAGWVRAKASDEVVSGVTPPALKKTGLSIDRGEDMSYAGLDASWEMDVFGKTRAKVKSSEYSLEAQRAMLYAAWVSLSSEVAMNYVTLRTLQEELAVTEASIANQKENLHLLQINETSGLLPALSSDQAEYNLHAAEAEIPELKTAISDTVNRISLLTGTVPGSLNEKLLSPAPLPDVDGELYNVIPAETLRQRPDIHAAEMAWAAQTEKTKAAKAELKPRFSILGVLGLAALGGGLFSAGSHAFGIMPQVTYPFFNRGALKNRVYVERGKEKERKAEYENTVLKAAGEVRSAMTAVSQDKIRKDSLEKGRDKAKEALELSRNQFRHGLFDYMGVLEGERHYLSLEQSYTVAKGRELTHMIALFKSLGGGWKPLEEERREAAENDKPQESNSDSESVRGR